MTSSHSPINIRISGQFDFTGPQIELYAVKVCSSKRIDTAKQAISQLVVGEVGFFPNNGCGASEVGGEHERPLRAQCHRRRSFADRTLILRRCAKIGDVAVDLRLKPNC